MSTTREAVRAVTDTEVAFFHQNGWVLLRELVSPDLCREMLEHGKPKVSRLMQGSDADFADADEKREFMKVSASKGGTLIDNKKWIGWYHAIRSGNDAVLSKAALNPTMGHNAQRLLGRDKPMRIYHDIFMCKLPDERSTPTGWHQDAPNFPVDRNALTIWTALDEITPDQGSLQFFTGSHRCGLLGRIAPDPNIDLTGPPRPGRRHRASRPDGARRGREQDAPRALVVRGLLHPIRRAIHRCTQPRLRRIRSSRRPADRPSVVHARARIAVSPRSCGLRRRRGSRP
jgi:phytanoyl-CoA dioxygenase PhyH